MDTHNTYLGFAGIDGEAEVAFWTGIIGASRSTAVLLKVQRSTPLSVHILPNTIHYVLTLGKRYLASQISLSYWAIGYSSGEAWPACSSHHIVARKCRYVSYLWNSNESSASNDYTATSRHFWRSCRRCPWLGGFYHRSQQ